MNLAARTLKIRLRLVKMIAPKLYEDYVKSRSVSGVPRPMITFVKSLKKSSLVGAEIGVAAGVNSESILKELDIKRIWLIDPYTPHIENGVLSDYSGDREQAKKRVSKFHQATFIQKPSSAAVDAVDKSLDFVYIDGNHDYLFVKEDIELYYPLVKSGGVLGGHDYTVTYPGVVQAVNEFVQAHMYTQGVDFFVSASDWWIVKQTQRET